MSELSEGGGKTCPSSPPSPPRREMGRKLAPLLVPGPVVGLAVPYGTHPSLSHLRHRQSVSQSSSGRLVSQSQTSSRPIHCLLGYTLRIAYKVPATNSTTSYKLQPTTPYNSTASRPTLARIQYLDQKGYMHVSRATFHSVTQPIHHFTTISPLHPASECRGYIWCLVSGVCAVVGRVRRLPLFPPGSWHLQSLICHVPSTYVSTRLSIVNRHQHHR